jgi:hypothetical protein
MNHQSIVNTNQSSINNQQSTTNQQSKIAKSKMFTRGVKPREDQAVWRAGLARGRQRATPR